MGRLHPLPFFFFSLHVYVFFAVVQIFLALCMLILVVLFLLALPPKFFSELPMLKMTFLPCELLHWHLLFQGLAYFFFNGLKK